MWVSVDGVRPDGALLYPQAQAEEGEQGRGLSPAAGAGEGEGDDKGRKKKAKGEGISLEELRFGAWPHRPARLFLECLAEGEVRACVRACVRAVPWMMG